MKFAFEQLAWRVAEFQSRVFPESKTSATLAHLAREVEELRADPDDLSEFADVLILTLGAAAKQGFTPEQLLTAAHQKMDVNNLRRWSAPDAEGVCQHVEEIQSRGAR